MREIRIQELAPIDIERMERALEIMDREDEFRREDRQEAETPATESTGRALRTVAWRQLSFNDT